ncbi:MAG: HAD family hydrolase [Lachnospiraceae bacterium]|nr:HAD family hydrolase [Lachnospiraceae bacterium]
MLKAYFMDFYGTIVFEDSEVIKEITQIIYDTGKVEDKSEIGRFWWNEFQNAFLNAYGESFETQRVLEYQSLAKTIEHFQSTADALALSEKMFAYWRKPPIFEDAKEFLEQCQLPIYIVSNIDRADIEAAIEYHGLKVAGVFTSEDARSYKPRKELFELALQETGLKPGEVIHVGDSLSSDVKGAFALGIHPIWINRNGKEVPEKVTAVSRLQDILKL